MTTHCNVAGRVESGTLAGNGLLISISLSLEISMENPYQVSKDREIGIGTPFLASVPLLKRITTILEDVNVWIALEFLFQLKSL